MTEMHWGNHFVALLVDTMLQFSEFRKLFDVAFPSYKNCLLERDRGLQVLSPSSRVGAQSLSAVIFERIGSLHKVESGRN